MKEIMLSVRINDALSHTLAFIYTKYIGILPQISKETPYSISTHSVSVVYMVLYSLTLQEIKASSYQEQTKN